MKRIQSKEYYDAVKDYAANNKEPAKAYRLLVNMLREDEFKLSDDLIYTNVDTLKLLMIAFASIPAVRSFSCCVQRWKNKKN